MDLHSYREHREDLRADRSRVIALGELLVAASIAIALLVCLLAPALEALPTGQ